MYRDKYSINAAILGAEIIENILCQKTKLVLLFLSVDKNEYKKND